LIELIRRGGMGVVYKALHRRLGHTVALKTMLIRADPEGDGGRRFLREVRAVTQLTHPNIVRVYEYGEEDGRPYYTMAFVSGGSLAQQRARFAGHPRAAAALVEKIARAAHYAHERGVLHRDLKPSNVLLDEQGEPLISDFGLAQLRDGDVELTRTGTVLGTPAYMAPEQAEGRRALIGPATDVWALGVILYELLAGRRPFRSEDSEEVRRLILGKEPEGLRRLKPALDGAIEAIVLKCLEKDPVLRYPSAAALADDLRDWLAGEPVSARWEVLRRRTWRAVRRWPRLAVGLVMLPAVVGLTYSVVHFTDAERPRRLMEAALAEHRAVELIGLTGGPRWARPKFTEGSVLRPLSPGEPFVLQSWELCMIELLLDPQQPAYRVRAEVRHRENHDQIGEAGIYVAGRDYGQHACFLSLTFNDVAALPQPGLKAGAGGNQAKLAWRVCQREAERWALAEHALATASIVPAGPGGSSWRRLEIELCGDTVRARFDGRPVGEVPRARVDRGNEGLLAGLPNLAGLDARLRPRGALGLYLNRGKASFRRVTVEPLEPDG
jgi:serine/threonine-protein kinase